MYPIPSFLVSLLAEHEVTERSRQSEIEYSHGSLNVNCKQTELEGYSNETSSFSFLSDGIE